MIVDNEVVVEKSYTERKTGFKDANEFSLRIEELKNEHDFDTYIETIVYFTEYESDVDIEEVVKFLNKKLIDRIRYEAQIGNMIKETSTINELF